MIKHTHEVEVTQDGLLSCRTCGALVERFERKLASFPSRRMAQRLLDKIAVAGEYVASSLDNGFVVYSRSKNKITEEVTIRRKGRRTYEVMEIFSVNEE